MASRLPKTAPSFAYGYGPPLRISAMVTRASGGTSAIAIVVTSVRGAGAFCAVAGNPAAKSAIATARRSARVFMTPSFLRPVGAMRLDAVRVQVELVVVD